MPNPYQPAEGEHDGIPVLRVETPFASAAISRFGAQVLSFVPSGGSEVLWLSPGTKRPPSPLRGGIPLCWPWFARQGVAPDAPQHGWARTAEWTLAEAWRAEDGEVDLVFAAPAFPGTSLVPRLRLRVGRALEQILETHNPGDTPQRLTQAMHSYFAVADVRDVRVLGLDGLDYLDKFDGGARHAQRGDWSLSDPRDPGRSDRIYVDAGGRYELVDPGAGRRIRIVTGGSRSVVVWSPGAEAVRGFADIDDADWPGFLCIEAANAAPDVVELAPGARHALAQRIEVIREDVGGGAADVPGAIPLP